MRHGRGPGLDMAKQLLSSSLFFKVLGHPKAEWKIHLPSSCSHYQDESVRVRAVETPNRGALEGGKRLQTGSVVGDKEQDPCIHFTIFIPPRNREKQAKQHKE